jgi:glutaconate CoA-transferase subunit B
MSDGSITYSRDEMMTVAAARMIAPGTVVFVGIGLPSAAANLARRTHAAGAVLIYESGAIGAKPTVLPLSIGDGELAETADVVVSVPEMFAYWLQAAASTSASSALPRSIDSGTSTPPSSAAPTRSPACGCLGPAVRPKSHASCKDVLITLRHTPRALVERLDFITSVGHVDGPEGRQRLGLPGARPRRRWSLTSASSRRTRPRESSRS